LNRRHADREAWEIGTVPGHLTANLTRWTDKDARVFTIDLVRGMSRVAPSAVEQQFEVPEQADWGRFAHRFGTAHKAIFITAATMTYDFGRIAPLDFAFIDGAHDLEHQLNDCGKVYEALAPGGWLVWHDFNSPAPWVKVREAIERAGFTEPCPGDAEAMSRVELSQ
jgi:predicted O-methyltransferase YrrM